MKTERLFYVDPELKTCDATVLSCRQAGDCYEVVLDRTVLFPESYGQPGDMGKLNDVDVMDTQIRDGEIVHLCKTPFAVGDKVTAEVFWLKRFEFMQQHTGEHVFTGRLCATFGLHRTAFRMDRDTTCITIDGVLTDEQLQDVERQSNAAIWEDIPVKAYLAETVPADARIETEYPATTHIAEIAGVDCCACGGVLTARTGQLGMIKVTAARKTDSGMEIEIACGRRAHGFVCMHVEQNTQIAALLQVPPMETAQAVKKLVEK